LNPAPTSQTLRDMTKLISSSVLLATLLVTTPALAGGSQGSIGVGADLPLAGGVLPEAAIDYDAGAFHVGGGLGIQNPPGGNNTEVDFSGHFYFHVASTSMSDFGVGGDVLFQSTGNGPNNGSTTDVFLDPGAQIRAFVASNVALSLTIGMSIGVGDSSDFFFGARPVGEAGFRYYFF
jgi:hypothetical protein